MKEAYTNFEVAEWILDNKRGNAFRNATLESLVHNIATEAENKNMLHVADEDGLIGVVIFQKDLGNKLLFIKQLLVTRHAALVVFIEYFKMEFAGYSIAANRNDEYVMYNTNRMLHLLEKKVRR